MSNKSSTIEKLYDTYSSLLYHIALQISPTPKEAEEVLIGTFQKAYKNKLTDTHPSLYAKLINLTIQTAQEQLGSEQVKNKFKLGQFEKAPVVHKLLFEQMSLQNYCEEYKLTRDEAAKKIRKEIIDLNTNLDK